MNRLEPNVARGLKFGMRLYLHPCLCVQAVNALVRLTACATASKNWILIEYEPRHAIMCLREISYIMRYDVVKSDVIISRPA